jgi:hypothetical protein
MRMARLVSRGAGKIFKVWENYIRFCGHAAGYPTEDGIFWSTSLTWVTLVSLKAASGGCDRYLVDWKRAIL